VGTKRGAAPTVKLHAIQKVLVFEKKSKILGTSYKKRDGKYGFRNQSKYLKNHDYFAFS
jgi:hypothetical protein